MKRLLLTAATALASVILTVTPAQAVTQPWHWNHSDPRFDAKAGYGHPTAAQRAQVDIVSAAYGRGTTRVWFRVKVRNLSSATRLPDVILCSEAAGGGSCGGTGAFSIWWEPGSGVTLQDPAGRERCRRGGHAEHDFTANTVQVSLPKSCFGNRAVLWHPRLETEIVSMKVNVHDWTAAGMSFRPNP